MTRLLSPLLLAAALLFSQHAALLHGLEHTEHELALASHEDEGAPALGHGSEVCAAFGALTHALNNATQALPCAAAPVAARLASFSPAAAITRIHFDSRAPPFPA